MTEEDAAFYRAALHELISIGTDLARDVQAARRTEPPTVTAPEAAEAFERIARATRRTILLATRLNDTPAADPAKTRRAVIRAVEDAITAEPGTDAPAKQRLEAEFRERLDAPEFAEDLATRPVAEIVADILRDLDLGRAPWARPQHRRRTPEALRRLHALARGEPPGPATPEPPGPPRPEPGPTLAELHHLILATAAPP